MRSSTNSKTEQFSISNFPEFVLNKTVAAGGGEDDFEESKPLVKKFGQSRTSAAAATSDKNGTPSLREETSGPASAKTKTKTTDGGKSAEGEKDNKSLEVEEEDGKRGRNKARGGSKVGRLNKEGIRKEGGEDEKGGGLAKEEEEEEGDGEDKKDVKKMRKKVNPK